MFVGSNQLKELRPYFHEKLSQHYEEREIDHFFFWLIEEKYGITKLGFRSSDKRLSESELLFFRSCIKRLQKFEPIQYIIGQVEFYGCQIKVNPAVLIPRPETEELVDLILQNSKENLSVLDIGTGSGCIPIALKKQRNNWNLTGLDISPEAINLAKESSNINSVNIEFATSNILIDDLIGFKKFDIIVSNPPYVLDSDKEKMETNVLDYEPHLALFVSDQNPLLFYDRIANLGLNKLAEAGQLFFEIHENYAQATKKMLTSKGYQNIKIHKDLQGKDRMVHCTR